MKYEQVTDSIALLKMNQGSNVACVALEDELIFIDTGLNTIVAKEFRKTMEKKYNKKASTLILTHGHIDHFLGLGAFSDCKVVAASFGKPRFERFVAQEVPESFLDGMSSVFPSIKVEYAISELSMPNMWVKERKTCGKKQELTFQVIGGHSECSSSIFYSPDRVLFVGDLIQADVYPYFGEPDTDMNKWINALKDWEEQDIQFILPGHGGVLTRNYVSKVRIYLENLIKTLSEFKSEGISEEELVKLDVFDEGYWPKKATRKPAFNFSLVNLYRSLNNSG